MGDGKVWWYRCAQTREYVAVSVAVSVSASVVSFCDFSFFDICLPLYGGMCTSVWKATPIEGRDFRRDAGCSLGTTMGLPSVLLAHIHAPLAHASSSRAGSF